MTQITDHVVEGLNTELTITVIDEPNAAGANHRYDVTGFNTESNPSAGVEPQLLGSERLSVLFQNGTVPEVGHNGLTLEALLAISAHRLQGFQNGQYACEENQTALDHINAALAALKGRTADRLKRQVEGKHEQ